MQIKIFRPGTEVKIESVFWGRIIEVEITPAENDQVRVRYNVAWYDGRARHTAYFYEKELQSRSWDRDTVGFKI